MGDVTVTKANVRPVEPVFVNPHHKAGEAMSLGDLVYLKTDDHWWKTDANALITTNGLIGIVVSGNRTPWLSQNTGDIVVGEQIDVITFGYVTGFSGLAIGKALYVSNTAGKISTTVGAVTRVVGYADKTNKIFFAQEAEGSS